MAIDELGRIQTLELGLRCYRRAHPLVGLDVLLDGLAPRDVADGADELQALLGLQRA